MLIVLALLSSLGFAALLADALPTRALGRIPPAARIRRARVGIPLLVALQWLALRAPLGPAAAVATLMSAWMLTGWLYTLALEHAPLRVRAIGHGVGGTATVLTALGLLTATR